jgi:hypothetical protein
MPKPDKEVVQRVLAINGRDAVCRRAVEAGWKSLREKYPDVAWWRRKSTRAAVMWENTVDSAISALAGLAGVRHVPHYDTASFVFDDTVLARFKLASIGLFSSNYPTPLAKLFHQHEARDLFGFGGHHRVEIVHVLNRFGTAIDWIGVVARDRRKVLWQFELPSGGAIVEPLPLRPKQPPAADRVLRPAKPQTDKESDNKGE